MRAPFNIMKVWRTQVNVGPRANLNPAQRLSLMRRPAGGSTIAPRFEHDGAITNSFEVIVAFRPNCGLWGEFTAGIFRPEPAWSHVAEASPPMSCPHSAARVLHRAPDHVLEHSRFRAMEELDCICRRRNRVHNHFQEYGSARRTR